MALSPVHIPIPEELIGPRVVVRPYRSEDVETFWEAMDESREHIGAWLPWAKYYETKDNVLPFLVRSRARWMLREDLVVGIFDRESGQLLGGSGLHRINWDLGTFEIGYWIRRTAEGHGYVREAAQLLTRCAFTTLEANRVEIRMNARNDRSENVARRLGFVLEGTLRREGERGPDGLPSDTRVYSLLREEFEALPWAGGEEA